MERAKYVRVVLPLRFQKAISYSLPEDLIGNVEVGDIVNVSFHYKGYEAVVTELTNDPGYDITKIKAINFKENSQAIKSSEIQFWEAISKYYMCTLGEVFKGAKPKTLRLPKPNTNNIPADIKLNTNSDFQINELTQEQEQAYEQIREYHTKGKIVLLNGVTGSGKTEIYIKLIAENLSKNKSTLYMLPEIAVSKQISERLSKIFGDKLLVYHSRQTIAKRKEIIKKISSSKEPLVILGLRSALFLPFEDLGLIIIDEEHDSSYKQTEPNPRYHGRDSAIILAAIHKANVLLGTATPSFESLYNVETEKYKQVILQSKYYDSINSTSTQTTKQLEIIDMRKEKHKNAYKKSFSKILLREIEETVTKGEQVLIFRSRRAYSPKLQCSSCGDIPKCPNCDITLSYHKFNQELSCHYCGYHKSIAKNPKICSKCGQATMEPIGAGTERIEEELQELFPHYRIGRYDADISLKKKESEKLLKDFSKGNIDILVGTQMISKGFDFSKLSLVAVIQAESIFAINDFRGDEKALQLLTQLFGRVGRRGNGGKMFIQSYLPEHPVLKLLKESGGINPIIEERKDFNYPPYIRLINIIIKDKYQDRLHRKASTVENIICAIGIKDYIGPIAPSFEKLDSEYSLIFRIPLQKNSRLPIIKEKLFQTLYGLEFPIIIDVDPV